MRKSLTSSASYVQRFGPVHGWSEREWYAWLQGSDDGIEELQKAEEAHAGENCPHCGASMERAEGDKPGPGHCNRCGRSWPFPLAKKHDVSAEARQPKGGAGGGRWTAGGNAGIVDYSEVDDAAFEHRYKHTYLPSLSPEALKAERARVQAKAAKSKTDRREYWNTRINWIDEAEAARGLRAKPATAKPQKATAPVTPPPPKPTAAKPAAKPTAPVPIRPAAKPALASGPKSYPPITPGPDFMMEPASAASVEQFEALLKKHNILFGGIAQTDDHGLKTGGMQRQSDDGWNYTTGGRKVTPLQAQRRAAFMAKNALLRLNSIVPLNGKARANKRPLTVRIGRMTDNLAASYAPGMNEIELDSRHPTSLFHEYGHYLDYAMGGQEYTSASQNTQHALKALVDDLSNTEEHRNFLRSTSLQASYATSEKEIFARFFERWVVHELKKRGVDGEAFTQSGHKNRNGAFFARGDESWSYDQLDKFGARLKKILRAGGLMKGLDLLFSQLRKAHEIARGTSIRVVHSSVSANNGLRGVVTERGHDPVKGPWVRALLHRPGDRPMHGRMLLSAVEHDTATPAYVPCKRCHGTGKHSYNATHGDTCYGCSGLGFQENKRLGKGLILRLHLEKAREPEPHEMTREQYHERARKIYESHMADPNTPTRQRKQIAAIHARFLAKDPETLADVNNAHEDSVIEALKAGKRVPAHVAKLFPDVVANHKQVAASHASAASGKVARVAYERGLHAAVVRHMEAGGHIVLPSYTRPTIHRHLSNVRFHDSEGLQFRQGREWVNHPDTSHIARQVDYPAQHSLGKSITLRLRKSNAHDVTGEPRDTRGRWVVGGGHPKATAEQIAHARSLGINVPPNVWGLEVNPDPTAKTRAKWRDERGRQQAAMSEQAVLERKSKIFGVDLPHFTQTLPHLRKRVAEDLSRDDASVERACAAIIAIMDQTAMRIGGEGYVEQNGTFGASSLRKDQVSVTGSHVTCKFLGKHHKEHDKTARGEKLAEAVRAFLDLPGDRVFQARPKRGEGLIPVTEDRVQQYLKPFGVTPKQFRTYHATRMAAEMLQEMGPPKSEKEARANITEVCKRVSEHLGNTPAMARSSYIDPALFAAYVKGTTSSENDG